VTQAFLVQALAHTVLVQGLGLGRDGGVIW